MPSPATLQRLRGLSALVAATTLLAACGGNGSSSPPPPPPPPVATLSLQGTTATGAAIAGATVTAKCNGGTGTATTAADGTYSIVLTAGTLPCVLKVTTTSGDLYSVATGTGTTVTANITPFTQLIVANLTGKDPAAYFTGFGASDITALTSAVVSAAQTAVVTVLQNNGINTSTLPTSLVSGSLVAANGSTTGNAYDVALDALKTKLTSSGTTLAQLTSTVVQTATSTTATAPSATPSVALDVALQPAAATCSALRSGTYRLVVPVVGATGSLGAASTQKLTVNATTPSITNAAGDLFALTPMTGSPCRFTSSGGGDIVVSQSGAFAIRQGDGHSGVGFPEQLIALADLAGDWNLLGYDRANFTDPLGPVSATASISNVGVTTYTSGCAGAKTCVTTGLPSSTLTVNAVGGYDVNRSTTEQARLFAFRAGGGEMMVVGVSEDGTFLFGTRRRTNGMPPVAQVTTGWVVDTTNLLVGTTYGPTGLAITEFSNTITSADVVNDFHTRNSVTNFTGPITRPETLYNNAVAGTARQGYRWRQPATGVLNSAGATVNVPEVILLPLRGMGLTATVFPSSSVVTSRYGLSVFKP